jgi:hypothetical protein
MLAKLQTNQESIKHPGTKGDATELNWIEMLESYLPERYKVAKAFVLDLNGHLSGQIDIVIFDRHYSPFLFNQDDTLYIPAESVYAVLEVKPELNKENVKYAADKAASVRVLRRTSAKIPHAGGVYKARKPFEILAGILTTSSSWKPPLGSKFESVLTALSKDQKLNFGCALQSGAFEILSDGKNELSVRKSKSSDSLIFFFLTLLSRLQQLGTVPAIDIKEYANSLHSK